MSDRAYRSDAGSLGKIRKTSQGGIIVPANITRAGVFTYDYADGRRTRELRHPDDVFCADAMASLAQATLTVGHPSKVTPDNYRQVSVGHVDGAPRRDGDFVAADLRVMDGPTIGRITKADGPDKLVELSCGYTCDVIPEKGTYNGEPYDARQTNHVYNHVGLGPKGWGRAGNDVRIRLDGGVTWVGPVQRTDADRLDAYRADAVEYVAENLWRGLGWLLEHPFPGAVGR
jgi:hypothetical protein